MNKLRRMTFSFLEELHVIAELGGGYEGVRRVTFEGQDWALKEEVHLLHSVSGFPDISSFESRAG